MHPLLTLLVFVVVFGCLSFMFDFIEVILGVVIIAAVVYAVCMLMAPVETQQAIMGLVNGTREILHNVQEGTKAPPL